MFPCISSDSTITELLSVIKLSFEQKECNGKVRDEAERILIRRVEDLLNEVGDLKSDVSILKTERELLENLRRLGEKEKINVKERLKKREVECEELSYEVNRLKNAETEGLRTIEELKRNNKELEEEITRYRDDFQQRISNVEEIVAGLLGKDVSDVRKGIHDNPISCGISMMVRSSSDSGGNHHTNEHNQADLADGCDMDVCEIKPEIASPIAAAAAELNTPIYIIDSDDETSADESAIIAKTNGVKLSSNLEEMPSMNYMMDYSVKIEEINGPKDSSFDFLHKRKRSPNCDVEANPSVRSRQKKTKDNPDKSALVVKADDVKLNSSLKEMSSVDKKMVSVKTEDITDSSFDLVHRRKTSDEANRPAISIQKTQDTRELFHDGKDSIFNGCSTNSKSVAFGTEGNVNPRKRYPEINSIDSDNELVASDSDIDYTIAKLKKNAWKSAAELVSELKKNDELSLKAVCALYRRTISEQKLTTYPSIPSTLSLGHFISMGGKELAELLTKGDQKHRLRISVTEVNEKCTEVLERCRQLAIHYNEMLFEIYRKGVDPFFCCTCL